MWSNRDVLGFGDTIKGSEKFELLASLLADGEVRIGPMTIKNNQRPTIGTKVLKKP
jgi:hypothetical protein